MDYDERGQTTITGQATPGATVRAYLDDKPVAEGKAGTDGHWRLAPSRSDRRRASTACASTGWRRTASRARGWR